MAEKVCEISVGGLEAYADYLLAIGGQVVVASYYDRSATKVKAIGVKIGKAPIKYRKWYSHKSVQTSGNYKVVVSDVRNNRDRFYAGIAVSESLGFESFITTEEDKIEDFYNLLMKRFTLPLLKEWTPYIFEVAVDNRMVIEPYRRDFLLVGDENRMVTLNGKTRPLGDLRGFNVFMAEEQLEGIVSDGLKSGEIKISDLPSKELEFKDFNDYITKYGRSLVQNLEKEITPLTGLKPTVDEVALYNMRLYPQQAAAVNGIVSLEKSGSRYALLNEGMGVGKTIQALSVCEGIYNSRYMKEHACSLKDAIASGNVNYRVAIMCPGHLVNKWAATIREEIPDARAIVVNNFSQFVELRAHGPERDSKEFLIMSKDFAKLGSLYEPIPNKTAHKIAHIKVCKGCRDNGVRTKQKGYGQTVCEVCGSREWVKEAISYKEFYGMVCPSCGELLVRSSFKEDAEEEDLQKAVLTPADFAGKTSSNSVCYHCGMQLWGSNAKPITQGKNHEEFDSWQSRPRKWRKIRHFKNYSRKSYVSNYVLVGWEREVVDEETGETRIKRDLSGINDYISKNEVPDEQYTLNDPEYGPRKYAPAQYIKKYLKGYFDVLILDECHKFEGAGSAQAIAAHALMRASSFTLGLTGTLLNGMATSIFHLLYMLDPARMKAKGFDYGSVMDFARRYGCVETVYEGSDDDVAYGSSSRRKQIGQPRVKPGISPLVYTDFLLDKAVFLDLSDLSKYLPRLEEKVEVIPMEEETAKGYQETMDALKCALREPAGKKMMSYVLNFGLSYPDKPYGRRPIMSITMNDTLVANPVNCDEYKTQLLNKEKRLVEIVNEEIAANRNCFVFCSYTGDEESNVTGRLKEIIERECNIRDRVQIITASNPQAVKREEWMHEKAAEGKQVFICNPKVVETGLDFCFKHLDEEYNYPTLIFYQMSYELAVLWQASRRAYRLNQREECKNYYLCYEGTLQQVAVQLMAEKQVATSAIQGKFSAEGLASMANGVDPRVKLAQALADGDTGDRESLENMFDVLNASNNADDDTYDGVVSLTFEEVMGYSRPEEPVIEPVEVKVLKPDIVEVQEDVDLFDFEPKQAENVVSIPDTVVEAVGQLSLFDLFSDIESEPAKVVKKPAQKKKVTNNKKIEQEGQISLFDLAV